MLRVWLCVGICVALPVVVLWCAQFTKTFRFAGVLPGQTGALLYVLHVLCCVLLCVVVCVCVLFAVSPTWTCRVVRCVLCYVFCVVC